MRLLRDTMDDDSLGAAWQELAAQAARQAAQHKPWLLKLLGERGALVAARYALWKTRLGRLRKGERRHLQRQLGVGLAGAALALALMGAPAPAFADTIGVDGTTCTLADAITAANTNTTTVGCTHSGAVGADTLNITNDIGLTTALPAITTPITIEGNGNSISRTSGSFRILTVTSGGNLTLNSATVSGGIASGVVTAGNGGGIYARSATLAVTNSTLLGNSALYAGGAIYARAATATVSNSTLSANTAALDGGGLYALTASVAISNSTISGNSAGNAGGIYAYIGTLTVASSMLSGNTAYSLGGGIFAVYLQMTVPNSSLADNAAEYGGGIYARSVTAAISNSTLSGNSAIQYGGGIYARAGVTTVANSTLSGNTAGTDAGGIFAHNTTLSVVNSTLSANSADRYGGGIYARSTSLMAANSTLSGNSAANGGGIYASSGVTATLQRSLISGNTAGGGGEIAVACATVTAANYNLFGHDGETSAQAFTSFTPSGSDINATSSGTSIALASILTTTLADNDSTVLAGAPPGAIVQTLALPDGSPAIDAAPSADCVAPTFDFDQRGEARNVDGLGNGSFGAECDIGAFELQAATGPVPRIVIQKQTRPDGDATPFKFNLSGPSSRSFTLTDNGVKSSGQIPAGIYTLEEILPPGWDPAIPFASMTCDDGSPINAIDLAADEVLVCRFFNYKRGNIVVKKVTIPPVAAPSFAMRLINNSTNVKTLFSLANTQQFDTGAISSVPTYKLLETVPGGWKKKSIVCDNGSPSTAIAIPPGGTVTCTVTNTNTAPSSIVLSNSSVAENQPIGALVGDLSATDAVAGDTHTFSFVDDGTPAAANNGNFQIAGAQLKTTKKFDFESKSSHNIKLMVTDSAGQTKVKAFVITILDGPN